MAIVALNITIVGLTSLADKRSVIGIDYGKYLLNKYEFFDLFSMYSALIVFAVINIASVLVLWASTGLVRIVFYVLLIMSFLFAMYYFFGYILREHPAVRKKIIEEEILGLYNNDNFPANFEADKIIQMHGGREPKKISSDVLEYFNTLNSDTSYALREVFGPDSVIYEPGENKADYRIYPSKLHNISWEFFQMFRYSDIQEKLAIEILHIFNGNRTVGKDEEYGIQILRFNNVARMMGQVNKIGHSRGLFRYKFIEYFAQFIYEALPLGDDYYGDLEEIDKRERLERYFFEELSTYIFRTLTNHPADTFFRSSLKVVGKLLNDEGTRGMIPLQERLDILRETYAKGKSSYGPKAFDFLMELFNVVNDKKMVIKNVIFDFGGVLVQWNRHFLYDKFFESGDDGPNASVNAKAKANYFLTNICTPQWADRVDKGESFEYCVKDLSDKYPEWKDAIEAYKDRWFEMLPGEMEGMAETVKRFKELGLKLYGLSNWSAETFDEAMNRYPILKEIPDRIISGEVGMIKPNADIFQLLLEKYHINPSESLFIDDNYVNVKTARELGMYAIKFNSQKELVEDDFINSLINTN